MAAFGGLAYRSSMPGRPKLQILEQKIRELGGDEWVFEQIADGVRPRVVAEKLGISRSFLYYWKDLRAHPQRQEKWAFAMRVSAAAKAEEGEEILDELARRPIITAADVGLATSRAKYRQWLASSLDKETYGTQAGVQVQVNVGSLHLDALRVAGRVKPSEPVGQIVEAEVLALEEGDREE
jgi:hypothetical protein